MTTGEEVAVPVRVAGEPMVIAGTLTVPDGARTVQLLVHGYTYDRSYWDLPYQPERHSYVQRAVAAGYATLAIDRVGAGASGRPPGRRLTWRMAAATVARVVDALRDGSLGPRFERVVYVGHSYGTVTGYRVADRHGGLDALVATGGAHRVNVPAMVRRIALPSRPPGAASPLRTNGPLYVTTRAGVRPASFGHTSTDADLLEVDERLKQTAGLLELPTALAYLLPGVSRRTRIPSLTVVGDQDPLFAVGAADCTSDEALADFERRFYAPGAPVEAAVVAGAGHCLNIEPAAPAAYDRVLDFVDRHVGT